MLKQGDDHIHYTFIILANVGQAGYSFYVAEVALECAAPMVLWFDRAVLALLATLVKPAALAITEM
jgi:hypothetical protein